MPPAPWKGILPSLPTPFDASGAVDVDAFRDVMRFAVACGAHGFVCFGLAGEVARLTVEERQRLLEAAVEEAGDLPVLSGATAENLRDAKRLARHAEQTGAAGIVIPPPAATGLSTAEIIDFIVEVAGTTSLPAVVQDAPEYIGVGLPPTAIREAAGRAPNISAVKLETSAEGIERWSGELGDDFAVFGGNGGMYLLDCLRCGADGIMPGADTIDLLVAIYDHEQAGRAADADDLFARLLPLLVFEMQSIEHYNRCAKYVLRRRGVELRGDLRQPAPRPLEPSSVARLDAYLERLGLAGHEAMAES